MPQPRRIPVNDVRPQSVIDNAINRDMTIDDTLQRLNIPFDSDSNRQAVESKIIMFPQSNAAKVIPLAGRHNKLDSFGRRADRDVEDRYSQAADIRYDPTSENRYAPRKLRGATNSINRDIEDGVIKFPTEDEMTNFDLALDGNVTSIDDTRDGDEPVADKITPNKEQVETVDQNGNQQTVAQPKQASGSWLGRGLSALGDYLHETPSGDPKDYWRHKYTDGKHIPTEWLRRAGEAEARMYGTGSHDDLANARMANQIRQQINELNRAYSARKLSSPGDLKGNRDEYLRQFEPLNARLTELTGAGATMLQTSNDPQLNYKATQYLEPLNKSVDAFNQFITADTPTRNMMAQAIMKEISQDKGALSDFDVMRFNLASLSDEDRNQYIANLKHFMDVMLKSAQGAGNPALNQNFNIIASTFNEALNDSKYMGAGRNLWQMMNSLKEAGVDFGNYNSAVQSAFSAYNNMLNALGKRDISGIVGLLENRISNTADNFNTWAYGNKYEGADDILQKVLSQKMTYNPQEHTRVEVNIPKFNAPPPYLPPDGKQTRKTIQDGDY